MGGKNPYTQEAEIELPKKKYTVTFLPGEEQIEVDPEALPYARDGQPGSILDIALGHGIDLDHACGGVVACSTCHVVFHAGFESCQESTESEEDMLDLAPGLTPTSRLGCQAVPNGTEDVVVEIPEWNRNYAKEAPH